MVTGFPEPKPSVHLWLKWKGKALGFDAIDLTVRSTDVITGTSGDDTFDANLFLSLGGVFIQTLNNADELDGAGGTTARRWWDSGTGVAGPTA